MFTIAFSSLQKIGKSLMLPVAVLPVAGLLLGLGAAGTDPQSGLMRGLAEQLPAAHEALRAMCVIMKASGEAVFANLPLIFAIGVALGFTENDGVAAIAGAIGHLVTKATLAVMASAILGMPPGPGGGCAIETGVMGGILAGALAAYLFNKYHRIRLPAYLGFFAGKRFVPIVTALACIGLGMTLAFAWPPVQGVIDRFSHWSAVNDPRTAATLYGFVERLLIPFGLHHIWNVPFFFDMGSFTDSGGQVVRGDINRFFAGDSTAGILSGAFFFKMFGLPAAAVAIWRCAKPQHKARTGGIMISAALTSFLTGITEPIEFAFLFVAPALYVMHACLAASAQFVANSFDMHMGFTFSQGGIDFLVFNVLGNRSHNWHLVLVFGPLYAALYYASFSFIIRRFNLKTPGREDDEPGADHAPKPPELLPDQRARELVEAFGGRANITSLDACITRLRVGVKKPEAVNQARLLSMGATGVMIVGDGVQAVFGPLSENLKSAMSDCLETEPEQSPVAAPDAAKAVREPADAPSCDAEVARLIEALGGRKNLMSVEAVALTRLRVQLADESKFAPKIAETAGVKTWLRAAPGVLHLVVGEKAGAMAKRLRES